MKTRAWAEESTSAESLWAEVHPQQYTLRPEKSNEFRASLHIEIHVAAKGHGREARQSRQRPQDVALVHRE